MSIDRPSPTGRGLVRASIQLTSGLGLFLVILKLDPAQLSKIHGPLIMALAGLLVLQDVATGSFRDNTDRARKLQGMKTAALREHFEKMTRLSRECENTWVKSLWLRGFAVVAGVVLTFGTCDYLGRTAFALIGYLAIWIALFLCTRTLLVCRRLDSYIVQHEEKHTLRSVQEISADKLEESLPPGWEKKIPGFKKVTLRPSQ